MNGRVQDAITGRFISPDPFVTEPGNTQNFNRYAYVLNNPLTLIDPSGFTQECWTPGYTISGSFTGNIASIRFNPDVIPTGTPASGPAGGPTICVDIERPMNPGSGGPASRSVVSSGSVDGWLVRGSTVSQARPSISESLASTERHIAELEALLAMGDGTTPYVPTYTTFDGAKDLLNIASVLPALRLGKVAISGLLARPAMVRHHLFNAFRGNSPASQVYRDFFKKHGIDVDAHTVEISKATHLRLHQAGNNWTTKWKEFIDANPNASTKEVYQYAGRLMDEYGIGHVPIGPYRP